MSAMSTRVHSAISWGLLLAAVGTFYLGGGEAGGAGGCRYG